MAKAYKLGTREGKRPTRFAVIASMRNVVENNTVRRVQDGYSVIVEQHNYAGHCRGGIAVSWAVVKSGLPYDEAVKLWERRVGKPKKVAA